ncbi:MAG: asparagine synthase (glutamine-hydrolyzing), partial [Chitinophagales bacterium]
LMCGLAGIVQFDNQLVPEGLINKMTTAMAHRGPDAAGYFCDPGIALGHRRLSIIDLSEAANQPFADNSDRYRIIFNGEMYNYAEVKKKLPDYPFRTTSDTEVLLAAYIIWGPECIQYFRGMFCFAIWDRKEKELFMARDRVGVKPLYYYQDEQRLYFASETRAILASGAVKRKLNKHALRDYFVYQSLSFPDSMIEGIQQLQAGSWIKVKQGKLEKKQYWDITNLPKPEFEFHNKTKVREQIHALLLQSVERRMVSDVPVAAFLSGGIDSSIIVGLMAELGKGRPNSFTISFDEEGYDESDYAEKIARKFDTHHTRLLLKPTILLDELDHALQAMDSPSGDGINTYVVSKAIRQNGLKVAISGVGGDELFAGYPNFETYLQLKLQSRFWDLPKPFRTLAGLTAQGSKKERIRQMIDLPSCSIDQVYPIFRQIVSPKKVSELTTLCANGHCGSSLEEMLTRKKDELSKLPLLSQVSVAEYLGYTQNTLLKDADQMSMAVSLELREPYFDHDLLEFALAIPDHLKKPLYPKSLLVESVKPLLPDEIVFRKKQGFSFPWEPWLKNELRGFCEERINNICKRDFIHALPLKKYWQAFLKGDRSVR